MLQNRVTPMGDIVAEPERGMFTGEPGHHPRSADPLAVEQPLDQPSLADLQATMARYSPHCHGNR
jgi:hypothetical protein